MEFSVLKLERVDLSEEHIFRIYANVVLRRIFGPQGRDITILETGKMGSFVICTLHQICQFIRAM